MTDHDATIARLRSERYVVREHLLAVREHLLATREAWQRTKRERDAARAALAESEGRNRRVVCVWCGHEEQRQEDVEATADSVLGHMAECPKRPEAKLLAERDAALLSAAAHAADALRLREALPHLAHFAEKGAAYLDAQDQHACLAIVDAARAALDPECSECSECGGTGEVPSGMPVSEVGCLDDLEIPCPDCRGEGGEGVREWLEDICEDAAEAACDVGDEATGECRGADPNTHADIIDYHLQRLPSPSLAPLEWLCEAVQDECAERWHDGGLFASAMVQHARCAGDCGWDQYGDHQHWHIHLVLNARAKEMSPTDILARLREGR